MGKRYRKEADQEKLREEQVLKLRGRGVDIQAITPLHPGGLDGALEEMLKEKDYTADQSMAYTQHNRETLKQRELDSKGMMEMRRDGRLED